MKIEKKAKGKGKAIIGIAMAAIMLASLVAIAPTSEARPAASQIDSGDTVYIGEQGLVFDTDGDGVYGGAADLDFILEGVPDTPTEDQSPISVDAQGWTVPSVIRGKYTVAGIPATGAGLEPGGAIYIDEAKITGDIILNTPTQDSIVGKSVPETSEIVFKIETNFGGIIPGACVDIRLIDPRGMMFHELDGQPLRDIPLLGTTMYVGNPAPTITAPPYADAIDLADLYMGEYTVNFKSDKATCNMLDVSSPVYEFTVRSEELSIEVAKDTVYRGEDIVLKVTGNLMAYYYLIVTDIKRVGPTEPSVAPKIIDAEDVKDLDDALRDAEGDAYPTTVTEQGETNLAAWIKTDINGVADVKISTTGADERTYTIKVYDTTAVTPPPTATFAPDDFVDSSPFTIDDDDVEVEVVEPELTFDTPTSVAIGEPVTIKGTISAGNTVDLLIEDGDAAYFGDEPVDENGDFEVEWDTAGLTTGLYVIDAYIDCPMSTYGEINAAGIDVDGSTLIILTLPPEPPTPEVSISTDKREYSPGDMMKTNIRISNPTDDIQKLSLKWYLGIPEYDLWAEMAAMPVNLPAGYDQTFTVSIPVGDWGAESFSGGHIASLTDTTTKKVISADSTAWVYMPSEVSKSKASAEIVEEITKEIGASTIEYNLTIRSEELSIEAEKTSVGELEKIKLTVRGVPGHVITMDSSDWTHTLFPEGLEENPFPDTTATFTDTIDADGVRKYVVYFTDTGTYTIKVTDITAGLADSIDISVLEKQVIFDIPASAVIGEEVTIKGMVSAGDCVDIVIEGADLVFDDKTVDENGEFEVDWDTSGLFTGSYRIDAYIDCPIWGWDPDAYEDIDADGSTTIRLVEPGLTAEQPSNVVAEGDDYTIKGTATGVDEVDIVLVGPVGYPYWATDLDVLNDLEIVPSSVTDNEFSEDITMTAGVNTGTWIAMVFSPGRDGVYGWTWFTAGELDGIIYWYGVDLGGKTQDQIVEIFKDFTVDAAGSDDLIVELTFEVETPYIKLDTIESVIIGEPLEIRGKTNREPGTEIAIWTIEGPTELLPVITEVEWPTADQGEFTATIDTSDAIPGTYTLEADDGDGNMDTTTVEILPPEPFSIFTDKEEYSPGDVMKVNIRISNPTDDIQKLSFKWHLGIPEYDLWAEMAAMPVNLPPGYDQTVTVPIPVGDWGAESFCGCHIVSLTDTTTKKVVNVDSATWIYMPDVESQSKTTTEIAKEITKEIEGVELQLPS